MLGGSCRYFCFLCVFFSVLVPLNTKCAFNAIWVPFPYALHTFQILPGYLWGFFLCLHWCHHKSGITCRCNVWFISPSPGGSLLDPRPAQDIAVSGYLLFETSSQFLDFGVFIQAGINLNFTSVGQFYGVRYQTLMERHLLYHIPSIVIRF